MLAEIGLASFEVISRRVAMMATGACSPAEYKRMVREKQAAAKMTAQRAAAGMGWTSPASLLAPWHSRVTANVKRLRRS